VSKAPEATRRKILDAAFAEFYEHGFQGGSINRIVEQAGITKGALFHHFDDKQHLGYAVMDDIIGPIMRQRWLASVEQADDPLRAIEAAFRRYAEEDIASGHYAHGCPLNNMAQEMSPLDEGFQQRINELYDTWRQYYATALERGKRQHSVRDDVEADDVAAVIVAAQMGIWGTVKSSRHPALMRKAIDGLCDYLESLRPDPVDR
jgi:AcrR family transcriptional regulator